MSVGTTLINLRRERGKTLADVEAGTKIMGRMLSALENERWDELPAEVYVKGYIQNYASYLGVDAVPLIAEYTHDLGSRTERPPLRRIPSRTVVKHRLDVHAIPRGAWIAAAISVAVVALAVWGVTALLGRGDTPPPIPPETTSTVDPGTGTSVTGDGSESDSSGLAADAPQGSFLLAVAVAEGQSSWISVSIDSLVAYEGTMPGGESKEWTVTAVAVIRAGQPASVSVMRDGQPVELPAPVNGISEITLTAAAE